MSGLEASFRPSQGLQHALGVGGGQWAGKQGTWHRQALWWNMNRRIFRNGLWEQAAQQGSLGAVTAVISHCVLSILITLGVNWQPGDAFLSLKFHDHLQVYFWYVSVDKYQLKHSQENLSFNGKLCLSLGHDSILWELIHKSGRSPYR